MDDIIIVAWLMLTTVVPVIFNALKGKYWMAGLGVVLFWLPFFGIAVLVTAIRLAKPGSWWYRNRYDKQKQEWSDHRFFRPAR